MCSFLFSQILFKHLVIVILISVLSSSSSDPIAKSRLGDFLFHLLFFLPPPMLSNIHCRSRCRGLQISEICERVYTQTRQPFLRVGVIWREGQARGSGELAGELVNALSSSGRSRDCGGSLSVLLAADAECCTLYRSRSCWRAMKLPGR